MDGLIARLPAGARQVAARDCDRGRGGSPRVKSFRFELPMSMPHLPGQHYDVRLAADGYTAERSYSIASSPLDRGQIELTIDRLDDGKAPPYFHDVVEVGDLVEVRGPFASYFVWRGESPALLVGGGSGVVPLMAMLRHQRHRLPDASSPDLDPGRRRGDSTPTSSATKPRLRPRGAARVEGHRGRIEAAISAGADLAQVAFVCRSNGFVEAACPAACRRRARPGQGRGPSASVQPADRRSLAQRARWRSRATMRPSPTPRGPSRSRAPAGPARACASVARGPVRGARAGLLAGLSDDDRPGSPPIRCSAPTMATP